MTAGSTGPVCAYMESVAVLVYPAHGSPSAQSHVSASARCPTSTLASNSTLACDSIFLTDLSRLFQQTLAQKQSQADARVDVNVPSLPLSSDFPKMSSKSAHSILNSRRVYSDLFQLAAAFKFTLSMELEGYIAAAEFHLMTDTERTLTSCQTAHRGW